LPGKLAPAKVHKAPFFESNVQGQFAEKSPNDDEESLAGDQQDFSLPTQFKQPIKAN